MAVGSHSGTPAATATAASTAGADMAVDTAARASVAADDAPAMDDGSVLLIPGRPVRPHPTYPTPLVARSPLCGDDLNGSVLRQTPSGGNDDVKIGEV